jgi:hypothetical protein
MFRSDYKVNLIHIHIYIAYIWILYFNQDIFVCEVPWYIMQISFFSRLSTSEIQSIMANVCILRQHVVYTWYYISTWIS